MRGGAARVWVWAAVALLAVLAVYSNSLDNAFHFDDFHTVVDNPAIRSLDHVPAFFRDANLFSVLPANRTYRPIVSSSLALDYALAHQRYEPFWFHVSTLLCFVLLLGLLARLYFCAMTSMRPEAHERNALWAIAGAAWFGLHPAMAETVNYVIQRGDVYCTLGCVAALVAWAEWPRARRWGLYLLPLIFALLSKPPAAVFPALLLMWVLLFEAAGTTAQRWKRAAASVVPSMAVVAVLMLVQGRLTPKSFAPSILSATDYRMTQPLVWLRYFGELLLPLHLNVDTDLSAQSQVTAGVLAGFVFLAMLLATIWFTAKRREWRPVLFGLVWFAVTQLPTSLYVLSEVENDHRMFFSFAGLMLAVVWVLRLGAEACLKAPHARWLPKALTACGLLLLCGYAWGAHVRNEVWHTEDSLWADDVKKSPHNGRGLMIYGLTLMNHGEYAAAKAEFNKALEFTPNYPTLEINLGVVCGLMSDLPEAEHHFQRAISLAPGDDLPHAYYGRWLLNQGRTPEAVMQLQTAVTLNPARPMQRTLLAQAKAMTAEREPVVMAANPAVMSAADWINRSLALNQAGQFDASIAAAREALKLDATSAEAWNNIAAGYEGEKRWDKAIAAAEEAVKLEPDFQLAKNNLAWSQQQKALGTR